MTKHDNNDAIDKLDLEPVRAYIAEKKGWPQDYAQNVERDYRDFLKLYAQNPAGEYVSTRHVDDFWHAHILHVSKYINDCMTVFGFILDHLPVVEEGQDLTPYHERHARTQSLFAENFGRKMGDAGATDACADEKKQAICFGNAPANAICFGRKPAASAICFGRIKSSSKLG